jgi:hypothetical protein
MDAPNVFDLFVRKRKLQHKTRVLFSQFLRSAGIDRTNSSELEKALATFRHIARAAAQRKSSQSHAPNKGTTSSKKRMHTYRLKNENLQREKERQRLRYADEKEARAVALARTRAHKAAVVVVAAVAAPTTQLMQTMAQSALAAALVRCGPTWPCYVIVVKDFVQQIDRCQPKLHLLSDMRAFFQHLGECASNSKGVRGKKRKFKQLNFETFALPASVTARLAAAEQRVIQRFFENFNVALQAFLQSLLAECLMQADDAVEWRVKLRQSLECIIRQQNFRCRSKFLLRYTPDSDIQSPEGLNVHVDHSLPVGSVILGGSFVSQNQPCLAVYPTHDTVIDPAMAPLPISYSEGDLVLFDGSFAHGSFVAELHRMIYSQFLATSEL